VSDGCLLKRRAASGRQVSKWIHRIEIIERVIVRISVLSMLHRFGWCEPPFGKGSGAGPCDVRVYVSTMSDLVLWTNATTSSRSA
jgi:hypothetical protein